MGAVAAAGRPILKQGICLHHALDPRRKTHSDQEGDRFFKLPAIHGFCLLSIVQDLERNEHQRARPAADRVKGSEFVAL